MITINQKGISTLAIIVIGAVFLTGTGLMIKYNFQPGLVLPPGHETYHKITGPHWIIDKSTIVCPTEHKNLKVYGCEVTFCKDYNMDGNECDYPERKYCGAYSARDNELDPGEVCGSTRMTLSDSYVILTIYTEPRNPTCGDGWVTFPESCDPEYIRVQECSEYGMTGKQECDPVLCEWSKCKVRICDPGEQVCIDDDVWRCKSDLSDYEFYYDCEKGCFDGECNDCITGDTVPCGDCGVKECLPTGGFGPCRPEPEQCGVGYRCEEF